MNYLDMQFNLAFNKFNECIYCNEPLPAKSREHIFNSCWGGTHKTGRVICDICNGEFSNIDGEFKIYTDFIMNAWQFKGERHKEVPIITTDSEYRIERGGKPNRESKFQIVKDSEGQVKLQTNAGSKTETRRLLEDNREQIEKEIGRSLTEEDYEKFYESIRNSEITQVDVGELPMSIELNIASQYRSIAHTIIKCLALFDPDMFNGNSLEKIMQFAKEEKGNWTDFAIKAKPIITLLESVGKLDVKYNAVEIFYSKFLGKVVGSVTILGKIKRFIIVSENYSGHDKVLFVREVMNSGGKLQRVKWESQLPEIPLLETKLEVPTDEDIGRELSKIAMESISFDAPYAELLIKLENIRKKHRKIDDETVEIYKEAYINFAWLIFKNSNKRIDKEKIGALLSGSLNKLLEDKRDTDIDDAEVQSSLADVFTRMMDHIMS